MNLDSMPELREDIDRAVVVSSLWLHTGYIGAVAVAAGLIQLFDPGTSWLAALALAFFGGLLAAASWHRARAILEYAERPSGVATNAPSTVTRLQPRRGPHPRRRAERSIEREARS